LQLGDKVVTFVYRKCLHLDVAYIYFYVFGISLSSWHQVFLLPTQQLTPAPRSGWFFVSI